MDLGAFGQIEQYERYLDENDIRVHRIRGIRMMKNEVPLTKEKVDELAKWIGLRGCEEACESDFSMDPFSFEISSRTRAIKNRYLVYKNNECVGVKWNKIHGKKRKLFKYNIRKARERVEKNAMIFNKYAGVHDVMYIHARIGGKNWFPYGGKELEKTPWFLERVDDPFDDTYCDIYAKITRW